MRRLIVSIAVLGLFVSACSDASLDDPTTTSTTPGIFASAYLQPLASCDALLDYYIENSIDLVGPWGLPGYYWGGPMPFMRAMEEGAVTVAAADSAGSGSPQYTGTNVQVAGVDEADLVKTDGRRIFTIVDGVFRIAIVGPGTVEMAGSLKLDWYPTSMLLHGNKVLLLGQNWGQVGLADSRVAGGDIAPWGGSPTVRIVEVDVTEPGSPKVLRTLDLDGSLIGARMVDGVARIAITSDPVGFAWATPEGSGIRAERVATEKNRQIILASTLDNWLPYFVLTDNVNKRETEGRLLDCASVMAPREFSGFTTLSLLSFDIDAGLSEWSDSGVVATASKMYATSDHTYLATEPWQDWSNMSENELKDSARRHKSKIHLFDTSSFQSRYVASGEVTGFLLNQFAMDEYLGVLRVASTTSPEGWWAGEGSESLVTTFGIRGDSLTELGRVDGLGKGERIFSVRFMGPVGYVVTFRQVDPLYVIDLRNPERPEVTGELKILGYSAYLHPVGEGKLLGLGQDADDQGRTKGTQLSLFDVSDPANPIRIDQITMDGGWSQAEGDHHAFTFADGLILAPYERWEWIGETGKDSFDTGVIAARVEGSTLRLDKVLRPVLDGPVTGNEWDTIQPWMHVPMRTIVIDGDIYTVTNGGISVHDGDTLDRLTYERF